MLDQIYNLDEFGMPLDPKPLSIASKSGQKHPSTITTGNRQQITVLACVSASGYCIPPLVVFKRKTLSKELCIGKVPGTMYAFSSNGWVDSEIFDLWFNNHFLAYAVPARPILLIMDGASCHLNLVTIKKAAKEEVLLCCLPPHSTHLTQPLDKGCFDPLKSSWREECHNYLTKNPGKVVTQYQFFELFKNAWYKSMTMRNIAAGFRVTGIYPFDPEKINPQVMVCENSSTLGFLPLCSPIPYRRKSINPETPVQFDSTCSEDDLDVCKMASFSSSKVPHSSTLANVLSKNPPRIMYSSKIFSSIVNKFRKFTYDGRKGKKNEGKT